MSKKPAASNSKPATSSVKKTVAVPVTVPVTKKHVHAFKHTCISQNFALVWLDESIEEENKVCFSLIEQLKSVVDSIDVFNDADQCLDFLKGVQKQHIFVIISPRLGQATMPWIEQIPASTAVFVFSNERPVATPWTKDWQTIRGVFTSISELCASLKKEARDVDENSIAISFVTSNDITNQDLDRLDPSFMYTQLIKDILCDLKYDDKSVQDLVTYGQKHYSGTEDQLKFLNSLSTGYKKKSPIWWYTADSFIYSTLNWALREQEFDSIIRMGFFIYDLNHHIEQLHKEQVAQNSKKVQVFRGHGISRVDFEKLQKSKGGLLAFNSFLSSSLERKVAEKFLQRALKDRESIGIYFTMNIDPSVPTTPFALVAGISEFKEEAEILFSMLSVFRIDGIKPRPGNERVWEVELTLTSEKDKQLSSLLERIQEEIQGSTPLYRLGALLIRLGQFVKAEEVYRKLAEDTQDPLEKANLNYQRGQIAYNQGKNAEANALYQQALNVYLVKLEKNHPNIATIYNNMGLVCDSMDDYSEARRFYEQALEIYRQSSLPADHPIIATCLNNIASAYDNMKDYRQALTFYGKAYEIYTKDPVEHPHLATCLNNMGLVHSNLQEYSKALASFENALAIGKRVLPAGHHDLEVYRKHLDAARKRVASQRK